MKTSNYLGAGNPVPKNATWRSTQNTSFTYPTTCKLPSAPSEPSPLSYPLQNTRNPPLAISQSPAGGIWVEWGMQARAQESLGRPLGWQPPGPCAVPGMVAAPPLPRRRQSQPAAPCLWHPRRKEGRRGREKEKGQRRQGGQGRRKKSIRHMEDQ